MSRATPAAPAALGSPDDVETQLYEAFQKGDLEALMALWADDDEVVCVHPGGPRLVGATAIRAGFEAIFANNPIPVRPEQVHKLRWMGGAVHHLVESIEVRTDKGPQRAWVMATNVYIQTPQGWRLAAHHASPGTLQEPTSVGSSPTVLH